MEHGAFISNVLKELSNYVLLVINFSLIIMFLNDFLRKLPNSKEALLSKLEVEKWGLRMSTNSEFPVGLIFSLCPF